MLNSTGLYIRVGSVFKVSGVLAVVSSNLAHEAEARHIVADAVEAAGPAIRPDRGVLGEPRDRHDDEFAPIPALSYYVSFATATAVVPMSSPLPQLASPARTLQFIQPAAGEAVGVPAIAARPSEAIALPAPSTRTDS